MFLSSDSKFCSYYDLKSSFFSTRFMGFCVCLSYRAQNHTGSLVYFLFLNAFRQVLVVICNRRTAEGFKGKLYNSSESC